MVGLYIFLAYLFYGHLSGSENHPIPISSAGQTMCLSSTDAHQSVYQIFQPQMGTKGFPGHL